MPINLISCVINYKNKLAIGRDNGLLLRLKEDLKFFKTITSNKGNDTFNSKIDRNVVLMGRKTWFSIPRERRPLKDRLNLVLTNDKDLIKLSPYPMFPWSKFTKNVYFITYKQFLDFYKRTCANVFVIGGGQIYDMFLNNKDENLLPQKIYLTEVYDFKPEKGLEPDCFMSHFNERYKLVNVSDKHNDNTYNVTFRFLEYNYYHNYRTDESQYIDLCCKVLKNGKQRIDRTNVGTISIFGDKMEFDISNTVPLLTTKRVPWKHCIEELLWFMRGDSVTEDTPILLKDENNNIIIKQIKDIFDENLKSDYPNFKPEDDNRSCKEKSLTNYLVWTDKGFSKISKVIRHKVKKNIYRINTHCGSVDVTEDHSLLDINGNIIKPSECKIGTQLLTHYPEAIYTNIITVHELKNINDLKYSQEEKKAFVYGFFYGDGSCGRYMQKNGYEKSSWALNNSDLEICILLKNFCEDIYKEDFIIMDTMKSSNVYKIRKSGKHYEFVNEYRNMFYQDKNKIVPTYILNAPRHVKLAFVKGYYLADGSKKEGVRIRCDNKGKIGTAHLFYLFKSLGFNVSIYNSKRDIFRLNCSFNDYKKETNKIKQIIKLPYTEKYVYDLETEIGRFQAGIGDIIVKNTDTKILQRRGVKIWDGNTSREFLDNKGLTHYEEGILGPGYSWQWRFFGANYTQAFSDTSNVDISKIGGFDQLQYVIDTLKNDPFNRRIMMSYWNPLHMNEMALPPCHYSVLFYVEEEEGEKYLSCLFTMRSNDLFLGNPFNIFSYTVLTYILALKCNMKPRRLVYMGGDIHIYKNHLVQMTEQLNRTPRPLPQLKINPDVKDKAINDIAVEDFDLVGYFPYNSIRAPMAI